MTIHVALCFTVPAITIAGSTVITSLVGTAGLVALPTMAAATLAPGVMSTSIAAQPIMTSTALLAGKLNHRKYCKVTVIIPHFPHAYWPIYV